MKFVEFTDRISFIDTVEELRGVCKKLGTHTDLGIDLESNAMYRYYHAISLIQISTVDKIYVIDVQTTGFIDQLREIFLDEGICKVFQDMQYDLALLMENEEIEPLNLFDIALADKLLRLEHNMQNLEDLTKEYLGKNFPDITTKQKSNWGSRPLSQDQIIYAANDVVPLIEIKQVQKEYLSKSYHLRCFEAFMKYNDPTTLNRKFNIDSMWKLRGIEKKPMRTKRRLKYLLLKRVEVAKKVDRPLHWFPHPYKLLGVAEMDKPSVGEVRSKLVGSNSGWLEAEFAKEVPETLYRADQNDEEVHPPRGKYSKQTWVSDSDYKDHEFQPHQINLLKHWREDLANRLELLPEYILDKSLISYYASLSFDDLFSEINFPGIPKPFHNELKEDLDSYLSDNGPVLIRDQFQKMIDSL